MTFKKCEQGFEVWDNTNVGKPRMLGWVYIHGPNDYRFVCIDLAHSFTQEELREIAYYLRPCRDEGA